MHKNIFELVKTKNDEGLTLTEMREAERMNIAIKAFDKRKENQRKKKHGDSKRNNKHHYLYNFWVGLKNRCNIPGGPKMYKPWKNNYILFKNWILNNLGERKLREFISLVDPNGNYTPGNIKWKTKKQKRTK